ncbi:DUF6916 family protein [Longimicrobium sp.]|jgi:hypothetical protein|uniref:DUF6916 family protein n=1 Tax=Longimicrobium sp. TaxID=2029185 RepID=UPI002ED9A60F
MADAFTVDRFLPHVGEVFHLRVREGEEVPLLLTEISRLPSDGSRLRTREPFSLVFHAAPRTRLEQHVYRLEHSGMEPFEAFVVPIEPDRHGPRFEVIFA